MLNLSIDNYSVLENNKYIMILEADVVSDGANYHNTYFSVESIIDASKTLANIPIICIFNNISNDFKEHARNDFDIGNRMAIGNVPESNKSEIVEIGDKKWQRIKFIIWKIYTPDYIVERFLDNSSVKISMEIAPVKTFKRPDGLLEIEEYVYIGISLLGDNYKAAIPGANAKVIKYSTPEFIEISGEYNDIFEFSITNYEVPQDVKSEFLKMKSKNPKLILFSNLLKSKDEITFKEIVDFSSEFKNSSYKKTKKWLKSILDNDIVKSQNSNIRKELKMKEKKDFSINYVDVMNKASIILVEEKGYNQDGFSNYSVVNADSENIYCYKCSKFVALPYSISEDKITMDYDSEKKVIATTKYQIVEDEKDDVENEEIENMSVYAISEIIKDSKAKFDELQTNYSTIETENNELKEVQTKFSVIETENNELKEFKAEVEKKEKQNKADNLYAKYSEFITDEDKATFNEMLFSVESFENFEEKVSKIILPKLYAVKITTELTKGEGSPDKLDFNIRGIDEKVKSLDIEDSFEKLKNI